MIREDALLALKEAEDKRSRLVQSAKQKSEANVAKARRDAALKIDQGKTKAIELRETLLEAKILKIDDDARLVKERGVKKAQRLKDVASQNVEEAVKKLMATFERELDV
ncbi:MAG: hypothetical protein KAJ33_04190 [Thermoplasmata archaeon]|nr:hypothetical protein [Thermoplasmata archaeon]